MAKVATSDWKERLHGPFSAQSMPSRATGCKSCMRNNKGCGGGHLGVRSEKVAQVINHGRANFPAILFHWITGEHTI